MTIVDSQQTYNWRHAKWTNRGFQKRSTLWVAFYFISLNDSIYFMKRMFAGVLCVRIKRIGECFIHRNNWTDKYSNIPNSKQWKSQQKTETYNVEPIHSTFFCIVYNTLSIYTHTLVKLANGFFLHTFSSFLLFYLTWHD